MKNFKVGDIVKGVKNAPYSITNEHMTKGKVVEVRPSGAIGVRCIEHDTDKFSIGVTYEVLDPNYFELVESKPEIRIYRKGKKVIAENTETGEKGIARCCPEDEFDFEYGARLALRRLTAAKVGDKVRIIADSCSHRFENGTILTIDSVEEMKTLHRYHPKENKRIWITEHDFVKCTEEDVLYNGKVVCIETHLKYGLTVGKTYEFKNGTLTYDNGEKSFYKCESFEDVENHFHSKFIEVVE